MHLKQKSVGYLSFNFCEGIAFLGGIRWRNVLGASGLLVICKLENRNFAKRVSVEYIAQ